MNRKEFLASLQPLPEHIIERARKSAADPNVQKEYAAQLGGMLLNGRQWLASHPGADVKIQFNNPETVAVIAPISEALKHNFVSTNAQGLELLKALWPWDCAHEPTVLMCRAVVDELTLKKR